MLDSTISLGEALISGTWHLFDVVVPGLGFTFRELWIGLAVCALSIVIARMIFGIGGSGTSSKTDSTSSPKISHERRKDEK